MTSAAANKCTARCCLQSFAVSVPPACHDDIDFWLHWPQGYLKGARQTVCRPLSLQRIEKLLLMPYLGSCHLIGPAEFAVCKATCKYIAEDVLSVVDVRVAGRAFNGELAHASLPA